MTAEHPPLKVGNRIEYAWLFPIGILAVYGALYIFFPERTLFAFKSSARVCISLGIPLAFVFVALLLVNLFVRSSRVVGLLGKGAGIKAMALPIIAGIISAGPIYAWYPLMKKLKEEGAGEGAIAVFLYNRAVKPFLLPVMIGYFGWLYVVVLSVMMILGSIVLGYCMEILAHNR